MTTASPRPPRPRPGINADTEFFWDGLGAGELRIQRCNDCGDLEHPPTVRCLACGSTDRGYLVSSGRGTLYSYVVVHHPQIPCFDYPLAVGLVELDEGVRLITNIVDPEPDQLAVGLPVEVSFVQDGDLWLHQFKARK